MVKLPMYQVGTCGVFLLSFFLPFLLFTESMRGGRQHSSERLFNMEVCTMTEDEKAGLEALVLIPKPPKEFSLDRFRVKVEAPAAGAEALELQCYDPPGLGLDHPSPCPDVRGLSHDETVEAMVEWFFANFENPAESTPCNEGEYVYIWGGPCDAQELEEAFSREATEQAIEAAVNSIETEGWEWAPSASRIVPEDAIDNWQVEIRYLGRAEPTVARLNKLGKLDAIVENDPAWCSIESITVKSLANVWPLGCRPPGLFATRESEV
jgi:hypothetical protein